MTHLIQTAIFSVRMVLLIIVTSHLKHHTWHLILVPNLNIRNLNKNFESLKPLLVELNFSFKMICITESLIYNLSSHNSFKICDFNLKLTHFPIGFNLVIILLQRVESLMLALPYLKKQD